MNLELRRVGRGDRIAGAGAIVLFVSMFFVPWWGITTTSPAGSESATANGWHMFSDSRWIWLATVLAVLVHVMRRAAGRPPAWSISPAAVLGALGSLSALLIFYRILDHPSGGTGELLGMGYSASAGIRVGIWLGFIAALAIAYGCYLTLGEEGLTFDDVRTQAGAAIAPATSPDPKPAPPAESPATADELDPPAER